VAAPAALIPASPTLRHRVRLARLRVKGVEIEGTPLVGRDVRIEIGSGTLLLGDSSSIGDGTTITVHHGRVEIGEGAVLGERCRIVAHAGVTVGRNALLGDGVVLTDFSPIAGDPERATRAQGLEAQPIAVGDAARVGHGACLLGGAQVPAGGKVAPHSVVGTR
jgi:acetyltransferase-like isoleucine patch superfamily enzyme